MIFLYILLSLVGLSILVVVHELGHFIMAKRAGVWVEEFGVGLPPRIWGKKIGETLYSINAIPLGGFVRLHGEVSEEVQKPKKAFFAKPKLARAKVILAGIVMNFLFGVFAFAVYYPFVGFNRETGKILVYEVETNSPAQIAGILVGDQLTRIDSKEVKTSGEFIGLAKTSKGKKIVVELLRNGEIRKFSLTPRQEYDEATQGPIGVSIGSEEIYYPPLWQRPFLGIYKGFTEALGFGWDVILALGGVVRDVSQGQAPKGFVGPSGIIGLIAYFFMQGILPALKFLGLLSINLAIINLIPFPPLDGSRLVFLTVEAVFGKRILPKIEAAMHSVGMAILIMLMLVVTAREIPKLFAAETLGGFVESLFR